MFTNLKREPETDTRRKQWAEQTAFLDTHVGERDLEICGNLFTETLHVMD